MPRKYEPCLEYEEYGYWRDHPSAGMKESRHGEYVKLSTYKDVVASMNAQIERLKKHIKKLEEPNEELPQDPWA